MENAVATSYACVCGSGHELENTNAKPDGMEKESPKGALGIPARNRILSVSAWYIHCSDDSDASVQRMAPSTPDVRSNSNWPKAFRI